MKVIKLGLKQILERFITNKNQVQESKPAPDKFLFQIGQDNQPKETALGSLSKQIITPETIFPNSQLTQARSFFDQVPELSMQKLNTNIALDGLQWYDFLRYKDSIISATTDFRISRILNTPSQIITDKHDPISLEAGEMVEDVLYNVIGNEGGISFEQGLKYLLEALPKGFAVIETTYKEHNGKYVPYLLHDKDQSNFIINYAGELRWITKQGSGNYKGEELPKNKFILHVHNYNSEHPYGQSIYGEKVFWQFYLKWKAIENGAMFVDRYAKPYVWGFYPSSFDNKLRKDFLDDLAAMGKRKAGASQEGTQIQILEASAQGSDVIHKYIQDCNFEMAVAILGQGLTLSNEGGGSYARDQVAFEISDIIFKEDAKELENTINKWIAFWVKLNYPNIHTLPYMKFDLEKPMDKTNQLKIFIDAANAGVPVSVNQVMEDMGIRNPDEGEDTLSKKQSDNFNPFGFNVANDNMEKEKVDQNGYNDVPPSDNFNIPDSDNTYNAFFSRLSNKNNITLLQYAENLAKQDLKNITELEDKEITNLAKLYEPVFNEILKQAKKIDNPAGISDIKIDPKLLQPITDKYFNDLSFLWLYGYYLQYEKNNSLRNRSKKLTSQLKLFDNVGIKAKVERLGNFMSFQEMIEYLRTKIVIPPALISELEEKYYNKAFYLSRGSTFEIVNKMKSLIEKAFRQGLSTEEFINQNANALTSMGFDVKNPYYLNNVFRTNTSLSYNAGQYRSINDPIVRDVLPFWEYVAVMDNRTTEICERLNGKVYRSDDPIWNTIYPPNHFQCRSTVVALDKEIMKEEGLRVSSGMPKDSSGNDILPMDGFQRNDASDYLNNNSNFNYPEGWGIR